MIRPDIDQARPEKLKRNKDGLVVFRRAIWRSGQRTTVVSVYGYTGGTRARVLLLWRAKFDEDTVTPEQMDTVADNAVLLTAMHIGVSDFIMSKRPVITDKKGNII